MKEEKYFESRDQLAEQEKYFRDFGHFKGTDQHSVLSLNKILEEESCTKIVVFADARYGGHEAEGVLLALK